MPLSSSSVKEFKKLYLKEYKMRLTTKEAINLGDKLIRLVKAVYGSSVPKEWKPKEGLTVSRPKR